MLLNLHQICKLAHSGLVYQIWFHSENVVFFQKWHCKAQSHVVCTLQATEFSLQGY